MHGFCSGSIILVNANVSSMGGIVDGGVSMDTKPSPRRVAIEKAQAELRLEYDIREERRRELEFLEKGGDPLDFKLGHAASLSGQSTSCTDQHPDQNFTCEAKGSLGLTPSPHRDSLESRERLGVTTAYELNSADNFDGQNEILQSDKNPIHPGRRDITPSEHSSQLDRSRNVKDLRNSPSFHPKKGQLYKRRNRSQLNRHDPPNSADMPFRGGHGSSMPSKVAKLGEGKLNPSDSTEKLVEVQSLSLKDDEALGTIRTFDPPVVVVEIRRDNIDNLDVDRPPSSGVEKNDYNTISGEVTETSKVNEDDTLVNKELVVTKGLDCESSCSQTNVGVDGNGKIDSDLCTNLKNVDSDGSPKEHTVPVRENLVGKDNKMPSEDDVTNAKESASCIKGDQSSISHQGNMSTQEVHADEGKGVPYFDGQEKHEDAEIKSVKDVGQLDDCVPKTDIPCPEILPHVNSASDEPNKNGDSGKPLALETQPCTEKQPKPLDKAQEDRILEEARMIVAKHKRIAALSIGLLQREHRHKCHWDLVLEEMAWLANDFAQERMWKLTAASQTCRRVTFASRKRLVGQSKISEQKSVANTLAKAVIDFWHSARPSVETADSSQLEKCRNETSLGANEMEKASADGLQSTRRKQDNPVYGYAVRFLLFNCSPKPFVAVEEPGVTDVACDIGLPELSWQDQLTEENLFYTVPPGAMDMYRKSIETCLVECERIGNNTQGEVVTSAHDNAPDNDFEEDEDTHMYYQPGASDTGKRSKKKQKMLKSHVDRSYDLGSDSDYVHCTEIRNGTTQLNIMGKRPVSNLLVDPIPMKRMRTASRQRVVGPFGVGPGGMSPVLSRNDMSSEDTNCFQDDQSTLNGGSSLLGGLEIDSTMNFEKQPTFDSAEMSAKPNKKKNIKHPSLSYDHRWPLDSSMQNEQKDFVRKRSDNHHLEYNGNGSLFGPDAKKPKLAKYSLDDSFDNTAPMSGSVASPVDSQSNMPSQTKLIKLIGGRERGKKAKGLKVSIGQLGSGSPWTIVEDQALVVLVHDMGPNWELVSDAINSILQFKFIFRKPQECKERHKFLMDRPSGDGADSGEDSGSSQPYPSTLPGIPKGSARQLFRSLHAHVEEDNIKSRFDKIIRIEQQLIFRKKKNDNQDLKQIAPPHGSHVLSLSQVIPNNLSGGVLTPLDLCDTETSNQDLLSIGPQSPHTGGLPLPHLTGIPPMHRSSGPNLLHQSLQDSPIMAIGNNLASPPSQFSTARDGRYSVPRSGSLPIEEHQRVNQYSSMLPGRNVQASNLSSSGSLSGLDRGVRIHPGGNVVNVMPGMNRAIPMARPGVQGIPCSASVLASNMGGMSSNMHMHSGTTSGRGNGNTMFRPRDTLDGVQPGQSLEHQRQIVLPALQIQSTQSQTNSPGVSPFGSPTSGFSGPTPEQQAYIRNSREKQMQQISVSRQQSQHQHQPHPVQTPSISSSTSSQSPMTHAGPGPHQQQKSVQGHGRNSQSGLSGTINHVGLLPHQQSGRQHPHQRQLPQSQRQAPKLMKGIERGNLSVHQNPPIASSHLNGLNSASSAGQGPSSTVVLSRNHHQLQGQPSLKAVNKSQAGLPRITQQNGQMSSDSLTKSKVNHSLTEHKSSSMGPPCVVSDSNVVKKVQEFVFDSSMTSESSLSVPSTSQAVTKSLGIEPLSSISQSAVFTGTTNSRLQ